MAEETRNADLQAPASDGVMRTVSWFGRHLLLPLTPFLIGALVRYLYVGRIAVETLSPAELSFSMAMMSLIISTKASQIRQKTVSGAITSLYRVGVVVFVVLFALAMFLETDIAAAYEAAWQQVVDSVANGVTITGTELPARVQQFSDIVSRLRNVTITFSLLILPLTIIAIVKYDMEEL